MRKRTDVPTIGSKNMRRNKENEKKVEKRGQKEKDYKEETRKTTGGYLRRGIP